MRQGALVARHLPIDTLLVGIAPAGVHPDLGVDAGELAVEGFGLEFELGVGAVGPGRQAMMARLLDLDHRAAGGGQFAQFGVHDVAEIEHHCLVVGVVLVPQHARQCRRADRAEFDRAITETLRDLPQRGVFERPADQFFFDDRRLIGLLHFPQDLAGADVMSCHPPLRGAAVALNAAQSLDRIEKPRLAADREVEAAIAVGHDVEAAGFLRIDDRRDCVEVLLAEQGVAERRL